MRTQRGADQSERRQKSPGRDDVAREQHECAAAKDGRRELSEQRERGARREKPHVAAAHRADHARNARRVQCGGRIPRESHDRRGRGKHDHERGGAGEMHEIGEQPITEQRRRSKQEHSEREEQVMDDEPPFGKRV